MHFAGETIHVEEVDIDAKVVLDGIAPDVACDDLPAGVRGVVGQKQRGSFAMEIHCDLAAGPIIVGQAHGLIKVADTFLPSLWRVDHGTSPFRRESCGDVLEQPRYTSDGDEVNAALAQLIEDGIGGHSAV